MGLSFIDDSAGRGTLRSNSLKVSYAHSIFVTEGLAVSIGASVGLLQKTMNWENLTFNDMIDERTGFIYSTAELPEGGFVQDFNLDGGILIRHDRFFLGYGIHHINGPNQGFFGESVLPVKHSIQAGVNQPLGDKGMITLVNRTQNQGEFSNSLTSLQVRYGYFLSGVGYGFRNVKNLRIGVAMNHFRFVYLYEVSSSSLRPNASTHEVALQILLKLTKNKNELPVFY